MKHITTAEYQQYLKGKKTKNWKLIKELLKNVKGGDNHEKTRHTL